MKRKEKKVFNVLLWNINRDTIEHYDVLPYFRTLYDEVKRKKEAPKTMEELKKFIVSWSRHQYWARCEYEMICHAWPPYKNDYKIDVYEQIMMNIDIITETLFNELINGGNK